MICLKSTDNRIIWKEKNDFELLGLINRFIDKNEIVTVREYQKKLADNTGQAPSLWLINQRFGSWDKMLLSLGKKTYQRYKWDEYSDSKLEKLVKKFITDNQIRSQRSYEKKCVGENMPSLSTLKKRFQDVRPFFSSEREKKVSDFEMMLLLKTEIERLKLETSLSRREFEKNYDREIMPSPSTIIRRTGKTWEELLKEIGFDYREIKIKRITKNLKQNQK